MHILYADESGDLGAMPAAPSLQATETAVDAVAEFLAWADLSESGVVQPLSLQGLSRSDIRAFIQTRARKI